MVKIQKFRKNKIIIGVVLASVITVIAIVTPVEFINAYYKTRAFPNVWIERTLVSGKSKEEIISILKKNTSYPQAIKLIVNQDETQYFEINPKDLDFSYDFELTAQKAVNLGKSSNRAQKILGFISHVGTSQSFSIETSYNESKLDEQLSVIAGQVAIEPVFPTAKLYGGQVIIEKGSPGQDVNKQKIKLDIENSLKSRSSTPILLTTSFIDPTLSENQIKDYLEKAKLFVGKKLKVQYEFVTAEINDTEIVSYLNPDDSYKTDLIKEKVSLIAKQINREPQNSVFVFEENKVKEFTPAKDGLALNETDLQIQILQKLPELRSVAEKEISLTAPVSTTPPTIDTADVNNLGIKELIGRGTSKYKGSIPSRVHNVALATSRVNGTLIKPGETFSFNNAVGDVSQLTGYKQAYVIKDGKTVLGDGGGLCQVSTTVFRAALSAGLPINERRGHSYRVGYYEQDSGPGLDATVYSPTTDFKFTNDTPGHILIQASADTKNMTLTFEFYGTSDGRVATTTKPVMTGVTAPPEDLYQDDPTLPTGQVKQVEHKAWGGKSSFNYEVKKGDQVVYQKTFVTNYRAWQAVYLRGTGPTI